MPKARRISGFPDKNAAVIEAVAWIPIFGASDADFGAIVECVNSV
jgi:hypothetical protein